MSYLMLATHYHHILLLQHSTHDDVAAYAYSDMTHFISSHCLSCALIVHIVLSYVAMYESLICGVSRVVMCDLLQLV